MAEHRDTLMTPKHHALLSSIAAIKDAAADEFQSLMLKLDALAAELGDPGVHGVLSEIRDGITRLSHSVISAHDTAAVLAEPMHMAEVPAPVAEPVQAPPEAETDPHAETKAEEPAPSEPEQSSADPGPGLYTTRRKGDRTNVG